MNSTYNPHNQSIRWSRRHAAGSLYGMTCRSHRAGNVLTILLLSYLSGCDDVVTVWIDPEIHIGATQSAVVIQGEPSLTIGFWSDEDYEPITSTETLQVVWGLQGGYWAMPEIRVTGIGDPQPSGGATMYLTCAIRTDAEEIVTDLNVKVRLYVGDGYLYAPNYPLPIVRQAPNPPDDVVPLDGVSAELDCSVRDNADRQASLKTTLSIAVSS